MLRLPRSLAVVTVTAMSLVVAPMASGAEGSGEERAREVPHYESPILSLLLLPVNLLIRMTAIVSPDAGKPADETPRGE